MKRLFLGTPSNSIDTKAFRNWVLKSMSLIEDNSFGEIEDVIDEFTINGTFTETFELNVTSPTAANIADVLATIIQSIQNRGTKNTGI